MARFEGVKWASKQMRFLLEEKQVELFDSGAKVYAVSRSLHYGQFLAFEGIRFFCKKNDKGQLILIFFNWDLNLKRFRRGISFNLSNDQQNLCPSTDQLESLFVHQYFKDRDMLPFFEDMADQGAQGYFRPFTVDEEESIGVTFSGKPSIRAVACSYDHYLGEPFCGVVVPNMVRAVGINKTGCLKLGINYVISVKAVDAAKKIYPGAASALFLDDNPFDTLENRKITEWDSSCCLFALRDGTVIKIPESPLILPSVTIQGITQILKGMGIKVIERDISYRELIDKVKSGDLVTACSVGSAGILNRCEKLLLVDGKDETIALHEVAKDHYLYDKLGESRKYYWEIYQEKVKLPAGMKLHKYTLS